MWSKETEKLIIKPFDSTVELAMWYDYGTNKFFPNELLSNAGIKVEHVNYENLTWKKCELHKAETFTKTASLSCIDNNLKMSILAHPIQCSNSVDLINDRKKSNNSIRFILKYSILHHLHSLDMSRVQQLGPYFQIKLKEKSLTGENVTHIVTDILYGVDIFVVFDRDLSNGESRSRIERTVESLLKKFENFDSEKLNWTNEDKDVTTTLKCRCYNGFELDTSVKNFDDVIKLHKKLDKKKFRTKPKQIWLYPLYLIAGSCIRKKNFYEIDHKILTSCFECFENLFNLERTLNDFMFDLSSMKIFDQSVQQLSRYCERLTNLQTTARQKMDDLLPEIRREKTKPDMLLESLKNLRLSSSNQNTLKEWLVWKTLAVKNFKNFYKHLASEKDIHPLSCSCNDGQDHLTSTRTLELTIHITQEHDPFMEQLFQCYEGSSKTEIHVCYDENDCWFNTRTVKSIEHQISSFVKYARTNPSPQNTTFMVSEAYADDYRMTKGITIMLYESGPGRKFEFPSKPGKPWATSISNDSLILNWKAPEFGYEYIRRYEIYTTAASKNQWKLCSTTENANLSVEVPNLGKGRHQFKVKGISLLDVTDESESSDPINILHKDLQQ